METSTPTQLSTEQVLAMRDSALGQMDFARRYTLGLLEATPDEYWSTIPNGSSSHFAWQVGHLAVAQYGLMLFRQRGRAEGDMELMPSWLRKRFGKGTIPSTDPSEIPSRSELMECLTKIHEACLQEVPKLTVEQLLTPAEFPYAVHPMNLGALLFCPLHEMVHAGQIGKLRRMHGLASIR